MSIPVKTEAGMRDTLVPWICIADGVVVPCTKVFIKTNTTTVKEAWPLEPGPVGNLLATTTFRNQRIEMDVDWDAPVTGEIVATYYVTVTIGGWSRTYPVTAPITALTISKDGGSFHPDAGSTATVTAWGVSAGQRAGLTRTTYVTIGQLPPPPAVTAYTIDVQDATMYHSWSHNAGVLASYIEIAISFGYGPYYSYYYATNVTSTAAMPWNAGNVGGGDVFSQIRTVGPGGASPWVQRSGTVPGPVNIWNYRFTNGYMRCDFNGGPSFKVYWQDTAGNIYFNHDVNQWSGDIMMIGSDSWARDNWTQRRMLLRPVNFNNGWTGRWQYADWLRKMANPMGFEPHDTNTYWTYKGWRNDAATEWQGSSIHGTNRAFAFYGSQFTDWLDGRHCGYHINITEARLVLLRTNYGGHTAPVSPRMWLHRAPSQYEGDLNIEGGVDLAPLGWGQGGWPNFPPEWGQMLVDGWSGYCGVSLYNQNERLAAGQVSNEYMIFNAYGNGTVLGAAVFGVILWHDG